MQGHRRTAPARGGHWFRLWMRRMIGGGNSSSLGRLYLILGLVIVSLYGLVMSTCYLFKSDSLAFLWWTRSEICSSGDGVEANAGPRSADGGQVIIGERKYLVDDQEHPSADTGYKESDVSIKQTEHPPQPDGDDRIDIPTVTISQLDASAFQGNVPAVGGVLVTSCSTPRFNPGGSTAAGYTAVRAFELQKHHHAGLSPDIKWHVWMPCGTAAGDREIPVYEQAEKGSIVLNIPGKTPFAAKAGLWQGLVGKFGEERAARVAPMTFIRPYDNLPLLERYVELHPNATFILKTGKHRQKGTHLLSPGDNPVAFFESVREIQPVVAQVSVNTVRTAQGNQRTAFRTYVWIKCLSAGRAGAVIEWRSPGYIAATEQDYVASGYTKSVGPKPNAFELLTLLFPDEIELKQLVRAVESKVSAFLAAFEKHMCPANVQSNVYTNSIVMEMFGFDWIPIRRNEDNRPDALLLETNRFADMALHDPHTLTDEKDWLKICTVMRRFSSSPAKDQYSRCFQDVVESRILASDSWEDLYNSVG